MNPGVDVIWYSVTEKGMEDIKGTWPEYAPEEAHFVRRLGWAAIKRWNTLPIDAKRNIVRQAIFVGDKEPVVQLAQQLDIFIAKYTGDEGWHLD